MTLSHKGFPLAITTLILLYLKITYKPTKQPSSLKGNTVDDFPSHRSTCTSFSLPTVHIYIYSCSQLCAALLWLLLPVASAKPCFALNIAFAPLETNFQEIWLSVKILTGSPGALTYLFLVWGKRWRHTETENSSQSIQSSLPTIPSKGAMHSVLICQNVQSSFK